MESPFRFPNEIDVIAEEAARFRALSPEARARAVWESFRLYRFLRAASGRAEAIDHFAEQEEQLGRQSIREFASRHGG